MQAPALLEGEQLAVFLPPTGGCVYIRKAGRTAGDDVV